MSDINVNNDYTKMNNLSPFKLCVIQNFPFIESDFDAVTNYQLLCKVVEYLNNVIDNNNEQNTNITQLEQNFITLYNYVKDYFDNLDVQEEINTKLDEMAADGSLSALIQPLFDEYKTSIDSEVNTQNEKIVLLENRMNTFTSLPSGSTSGDAELIDIRVPASGFNDNKTYSTAGEAVRGQVSTLKVDLESLISDNNILNWFNTTLSESGIEHSVNRISSGWINFDSGDSLIINYVPIMELGAPISSYRIIKYSDYSTFESGTTWDYKKTTLNEHGLYRIVQRYTDNRIINNSNIIQLENCISFDYPKVTVKGLSNDLQLKNKNTRNKIILNFGDSIANGNGNNDIGYAELIGVDFNMDVKDYAINGLTMAERTGIVLSVPYQVNKCINENSKADIILLEGGTNDISHNIPIGILTDNWNGTDFNTQTFLGALEKSIYDLKIAYPKATTIFIIVHKMASRDLIKQKEYHNAIITACEKWSIPFVDIYNEGQITSLISSIAKIAFPVDSESETGYDRTHPNEFGYRNYYLPLIERKILDYIN